MASTKYTRYPLGQKAPALLLLLQAGLFATRPHCKCCCLGRAELKKKPPKLALTLFGLYTTTPVKKNSAGGGENALTHPLVNTTSAAEASASPLLLRKGKILVASLQQAPVGSYWTVFLGCRRVHWRAGRRKLLLLGMEKFRPFRWVHQVEQSVRLCHVM